MKAKRDKRIYRRATAYPHALTVSLDDKLFEAMRAVADKTGWSVAEAARQALRRGLPALRQSLRPSRRPGRPA